MKRQGRNLELNLRADDVVELESVLRALNFQIADPPGLFGSTTLLAIQRFQADQQIAATGIVDARTARLINQRRKQNGTGRLSRKRFGFQHRQDDLTRMQRNRRLQP